MKKRAWIFIMAFIFVLSAVSGARALTIDLFDWAFYVDGTLYESLAGGNDPSSTLPSSFDHTGFDWDSGLGTIVVGFSDPGSHTFLAFFDQEVTEEDNTFFNEHGAAANLGAKPGNQTWEIDEPGYQFGDIYDNLAAGSLDNGNNVPSGLEDDVSMALGWDFSLDIGETGGITLVLSDTEPGGFYLRHTDPAGLTNPEDINIYYSGTLDITGPRPVPEPAAFILLGSGLAGLIVVRRMRGGRRL